MVSPIRPPGYTRRLAAEQEAEWRAAGFLPYAEVYQIAGFSIATLGSVWGVERRHGVRSSWIHVEQLAAALRANHELELAAALLDGVREYSLYTRPLPETARTRALGRPRGAKTRRSIPPPRPSPPADPAACQKLSEALASLISAQDAAQEAVQMQDPAPEAEEITYPVSFALRDRLFGKG